jgi:antitoxin VapB
MAVQLNIKDPETVRLARALADATGKSVTETIRAALDNAQRQHVDMQNEQRARVAAALDEVRRHRPAEWQAMTSAQLVDELYEADGSFAR